MLTGAGQLLLSTRNLGVDSVRGENLLMPGCIASFSLTPEENSVDALCLEDNIVQVAASAVTRRTWTMSLEFQYQDWATIQLAYDEVAQKLASVNLPVAKTAVIDENGEILDADISPDDEQLMAYLSSNKPIFLRRDGTGVEGFTVGAGKLVFALENVGKKVTYRVEKIYTDIEAIGVAGEYDRFGSIQFTGIIGGTSFNRGMQIVVPELNRSASPELTVNGDLAALTIQYRLATPFGARAPFSLYNLG